MAKKMVIKLKNNRPNLINDFTSWVEKHNKAYGYYGYFDGYDDFYNEWDGDYGLGCDSLWGYPTDEDDDDFIWANQRDEIKAWQEAFDRGLTSLDDDEELRYQDYWNKKAEKKRNKKKENNRNTRRGGKGKKKDKDIEHVKLSDEEVDNILDEKKTIYYYPDINQKEDVKVFKTLRKFFLFLDEEGIDISDREGSLFIREEIRHCCINPLKQTTLGTLEIISDHSYGALAYEVSEDAAVFRD